MSSPCSVTAIISTFNEADIIGQVVGDLIRQGVDVYVIDDGSTDETVERVAAFRGRGLLGVEQRPRGAAFEWETILTRKQALARSLGGDWFIHHDADEFRESPWPGLLLRDAIGHVDSLGYNAIDFCLLNFWPSSGDDQAALDVRERLLNYAPAAAFDRRQVRCWKRNDHEVDLASSGGHDVAFPGRRVFPLRFVLRHYPIRDAEQGRRKIFRERLPRYLPSERVRPWHIQYDGLTEGELIAAPDLSLTEYDSQRVRDHLFLQIREAEAPDVVCGHERQIASLVERLRAADAEIDNVKEQGAAKELTSEAERSRLVSACEAARAESAALCADLNRTADQLRESEVALRTARQELGRLEIATADSSREIATLRTSLTDLGSVVDAGQSETRLLRESLKGTQQSLHTAQQALDALYASRSWRWTSPARTLGRVVGAWFTPRNLSR